MSIPRNHHYVSECHINNFFNHNQKKIFYYDKQLNNFDFKLTKKSIFSEKDSNSRLVNDEIDHKSLEDELRDNFENDFPRNFDNVKEIIKNPDLFSTHLQSLINLTKFAIINIIRNPAQKSHIDNSFAEQILEKALPNATPEFAAQLEELFNYVGKTKYSNAIDYVGIADDIFNLMGKVNYTIFEINTNDYFILPDWYSITERINYAPDSLGQIVVLVGIPLSSKIFLLTRSYRVSDAPNMIIKLNERTRGFVKNINDTLYRQAIKTVACESENYLYSFINNEID